MKARLLRAALLAAALTGGCKGAEDDLLVAASLDGVYRGSASAAFQVTNKDPASFGTIKGRVVFEGAAPKPRQVDFPSNQPYCRNAHRDGLFYETFVVGPGGGLQGVVVYLKKGVTGMKFDAPSEPAVLDQAGCQYVPHVLLLRAGQPLVVKSSDDTLHNVQTEGFNQAMSGKGVLPPMTFNRQEVAKKFVCQVHTWMSAWVAVLPHPFAAVTGPDGSFEIKGVPPGKYVLAAWHEDPKLGEIELGTETEPFVLKDREERTESLVFKKK